jgi:nucleotide-binding universal stress UspA family protein
MYYRPGLKSANSRSATLVPNHHPRFSSEERISRASFRFTARRILIPVAPDGAASAIQYVVDSVQARNAEVHLLNVQRLTVRGYFALDAMLQIESRAKRAIGMETLNHARVPLEAIGVNCRTTVIFGEPAQMIAHYAREQDIDAIVMQTNRLHWLKRLLSGAVSARVTRLAGTEVTLVSPAGGSSSFNRASNGVSLASRLALLPIPADQRARSTS